MDLHVKVNARGCCQAERLGEFCKVKLVDIENVSLFVRGVGLKIRSVAILCGTVQVIVTLNQLHELLVHVGELVLGELIFVRLDLGLL